MPTTTERIDLNETLARLVAIEQECTVSEGFESTAYPRFIVVQETGEYWKNRIGPHEYSEPESEELDSIRVPVIARFILGRRDSNLPGDNEDALYKVMARFPDYVNEREGLQSTVYPDYQDHLDYAYVSSCTGYTEFLDNSGAPDPQVGTEFTVDCFFRIVKDQQYS